MLLVEVAAVLIHLRGDGCLLYLERGDATLDFLKSVFESLGLTEGGLRVNHLVRVCLVEETRIVETEIIDGLHLNLVEPLDALAIFPQTVLSFVVLGHHVSANAVLLSFVPVAFVASAVSPSVHTEAMLLVILVFTLVHSAVVPNVNAHTLHVILEPLAFVPTTVEP